MLDFLITGLGYMMFFMVPLMVLPVAFNTVYRLRLARRSIGLSAEAIDRHRINFNIFRYVAYLLMIPAIMLVTSVIMGYIRGFATVMDSMPGLIGAITVTFTWAIYRLIGFVAARGEYERQDAAVHGP